MSFLEKCVLFFSHSLGIACNIDNIEHHSGLQNTEMYKLWEYTIIRDPNNSNFAFIWSPGAYFLVNLGSADYGTGLDILVDMSMLNSDMPQKYGKIKKVGFIPDTNRLVIVYNGKPNKSLSKNNIFAQDYYIKETYMINYKTTKLKYIRTDVQSYTNGVAPSL